MSEISSAKFPHCSRLNLLEECAVQRKEKRFMATCDELATQLSGLQSQLADLQYQKRHPNEACADQGLTGDDCILYIKSLGGQIASVQTQITGAQTQITGVQQQQKAQNCPFGPDGAPISVQRDAQGNLASASAIGTDGVKRR